jgi:CBS domain-containing protein
MLVKEIMSRDLVWCTPSDTAQTAAKLMKDRGVGALPVVSDGISRKLEGIVTDRDLCCTIVAGAQLAEATRIADVMTQRPVTCAPENAIEDCEKLMQKHQIRRIPVIDAQGRCVGMVAQADIALHAPAGAVATTLAEISKSLRPAREARAAI